MNSFFMAWRNLWRNKRRTFITIASIFFGVFLSAFMSSMQEGSYSKMVENVVKFYSGYLQIQQKDYWDNKTINNTFRPDKKVMQIIAQNNEITQVVPKLESFALASYGESTKAAGVFGVNPEQEEKMSGISKWITSGKYLKQHDNGVLITGGLASSLNIGIGDTLVLLSQGYHGLTAAGLFPVRGILTFPTPDLNKGLVYMDLKQAQNFYSADSLVTSLVLMVKNHDHVKPAKNQLMASLPKDLTVMTWDEMQPEVVQQIDSDRSGGIVMKAILYIVIGFGVLGTIIMMVAERRRELGVMVAVGMKKRKLSSIIFFETIFIGIIGVLLGVLFSLLVLSYYYGHPIKLTGNAAQTMLEMGIEPYMYFSMQAKVFVNQAITVFIITLFIALYPAFSIARFKVAEALRG
jgi:ABC-type lipoprotein release transport system permease subunit